MIPDAGNATVAGSENHILSFSATVENLEPFSFSNILSYPTVSACRNEYPLPSYNPALMRPAFVLIKPLIDILLIIISAPAWIPVCLITALCIWLEDRSCPIFFQKRIGLDGQEFTIWKFRTMIPDAGQALDRFISSNESIRSAWDETFKLKEDPRITAVGRWIRRYSIDELPQLVNILMGHMSLIGPRPLPAYHHRQLSASTRAVRELVKPGLTGLWQISGRSDIGNRGMELWDPYYVRNWSPKLDLSILFRTIRTVLNGSGAY
jgi:lipopolysaccharide/colanic/teichoic acid biosynthesis glycosyltransferase